MVLNGALFRFACVLVAFAVANILVMWLCVESLLKGNTANVPQFAGENTKHQNKAGVSRKHGCVWKKHSFVFMGVRTEQYFCPQFVCFLRVQIPNTRFCLSEPGFVEKLKTLAGFGNGSLGCVCVRSDRMPCHHSFSFPAGGLRLLIRTQANEDA